MGTDASNHNALWASALVEAVARCGVRLALISPGSRSAPLATAFTRHPSIDTVIHFDERAAAFFALGAAKASGLPVAVVCTSGTAVANLLPAAVEACQSGIPLLLVTADRPRALVEAGANQTIDQQGLFGVHARWACNLPCPDTASDPSTVFSIATEAVRHALGPPAGPVHLNCPFEEPLDPVECDWDRETALDRLAAMRTEAAPLMPPDRLTFPGDALQSASGCVIAGTLSTDADRQAGIKLASVLGWPLLPDVTSGLRFGNPCANAVPHYDLALAVPTVAETFRPQAVIHLGGPWISKRLQSHLGQHPPEHWIHVAPRGLRWNPLMRPLDRLERSVAEGCSFLIEGLPEISARLGSCLLRHASAIIGPTLDRLSASPAWSEPFIMRRILQRCDSAFFLGNSLPIRLADTFGAAQVPPRPIYANRGASGIDGCIATAAGIARAGNRPLTCVLGDLAALHDLNAMAMLRQVRVPFRLVIFNNDGGGIFHFLPIAQYPDLLEPLFTTPHGLTFEHAAAMFGLKYHHAADWAGLDAALADAPRENAPQLIEVTTCRTTTHAVWRETEQGIRKAITESDNLSADRL